jgi:hypothetical protein
MPDVDLATGGGSLMIVSIPWLLAGWHLSKLVMMIAAGVVLSAGFVLIGFAPSDDADSDEDMALTADQLEDGDSDA